MFYQKQPNWDVYFRKTATGHNQIQNHLHGFFELQCCTEGQLHLVIDGKECILRAGEAALIFPYQPHSFSVTGGKGWFFTFEPGLIGTFSRQYANLLPRESRFSFTYDFASVSELSDVYAIKSFLYAMCSEVAGLEFVQAPTAGRELLEKMLLVTEENYKNPDFSLERLAELLEYDYGYLSKYFLKVTGMKFGFYLNRRRIDFAGRLLKNGEVDNISDAAFACGYSSVRTFNRNFKEIEGKTPGEYIKRAKDESDT